LGLAVVISAVLGAVIANADTRVSPYAIIDLGTLGGTESFGYALNNGGEVVGVARVEGDTSTHGFMYSFGTLRDLFPFGPMDINNVGQVAGGVVVDNVFVPALGNRRTGQVSTLGSLGGVTAFGYSGVATAVNDRGQAVGFSYLDELNRHAFLFSDGVLTDIGSFGGYSGALAINRTGQIAGFASDTVTGVPRAFVYRDGVMLEINPFNGPNNESVARGINDRGKVVGEALNAAGTAFHGFIYSRGRIEDLGTLDGGLNSVAISINDDGQVVGIADSPYEDLCFNPEMGWVPCIQYRQRAFLYQHGTMTDLNALIRPNSGWDLQWAFDINDHGQIAGYGVKDGKFRAFLMTPKPKAKH
jgi:probable HAF family extracellular repeat protein